MALITISELRTAAGQARNKKASYRTSTDLRKALNEEFRAKPVDEQFDVFLSHTFRDADHLIGLREILEDYGYKIYIDWVVDAHLDRANVTKDTAAHVKMRMKNSKCLFFATSENSPKSKWMPWELGYFDGLKGRVAICPVVDEFGLTYVGQEYLGLYPYATTGRRGVYVHDANDTYILMDRWLLGHAPTKQSE
jgi:hypothetical protein